MNTDALVTQEPPESDDLTLVALTPAEMAPAQTALAAWCDRKVAAVRAEAADLDEHLKIATANGWKLRGLMASLNRTEKRVTYYQKMKAAIDAGYLIVPNFPITVFAVRVQRAKQREAIADYGSSGAFDARPELLSAGEGRYVDDRVFYTPEEYEGKNYQDEAVTKTRCRSGDYDAVDFPVLSVKPVVLAATQRAMALKVFDQLGIVRNESAGKDPIVVGQLLDPRGRGRCATFFIAWWLDTSTL